MTTSIIVSYDNSPPDKPILIVGKKRINKSIDIINAFEGDEAVELFNRLITVKKGE